jgi:predicted RNase H-like nuclease (RuvC/YqgF family)
MITINEKHPCAVARQEGETKLNELRMQLRPLLSERDSKLQRFLAQKSAERSNERSKLDSEADQLLTGSASTDQVSAQDIEDLNHKIAVLERAIEKQLNTVSKLRTEYSVFVCESKAQRDRYIEIQRRIASRVEALAQANQEEVDFFDELHAAGVTPRFRPMRVSAVGLASDPNSIATFHYREVKQYCPEALA